LGEKGLEVWMKQRLQDTPYFVPFNKHNYDDRLMGEEMDGCTGG